MNFPVALQAYTVREELAKDLEGTLARLAEGGYEAVEIAGMYDQTPRQMRDLLRRLGLKPVGMHVSLAQLQEDLSGALQSAQTLGIEHLTCPWIPADMRTAEGYRQLVKQLIKFSRLCHAEGVTLSYHNHAFEWDRLADGSRGIDILFNETDPADLQSELDVAWCYVGGEDPAQRLRKLTGRVPLVHAKDVKPLAPGAPASSAVLTEIGTGALDWPAVIRAAVAAGARCLIIEQDNNWVNKAPVESALQSLNHLKAVMEKM